jgi:pimeloyl-ACP methyl ester carboxylesterase
MSGERQETVVVTHGLWLGRWNLLLLGAALRRSGFTVRYFGYASVRRGLKENAERLRRFVQDIDAPAVHFVGHSLGGIVIRALFHYFPDQRPGRIVTIATPHQGAHVANFLSRWAPGRWIIGKSIMELVAGEPRSWLLPAREIGLITGDFPLGIGRLFPGMTDPNDGLLNEDETRLAAATDRVCVRMNHTAMQFSREVARQVIAFIKVGRFESI